MMVDWKQKWQQQITPWDLGRPHPGTQLAIDAALRYQSMLEKQSQQSLEKRVLLPLCGTAHDSLPFLQQGFAVQAFDLSPVAVAKAHALYHDKGLHVCEADVFAMQEAPLQHPISFVLDRAALCAVGPEQRGIYLEVLIDRLCVGGYYLLIAFSKVASEVEGPPYALSAEALASLFLPTCDLIHAECLEPPKEIPAILAETLYVWRKR